MRCRLRHRAFAALIGPLLLLLCGIPRAWSQVPIRPANVLRYPDPAHPASRHRFNAVATDGDGSVIAVGVYSATGNASDDDWLIVKYDRTGKLLWQATYNGSATNSDDAAVSVAVDAKNNNVIYVTGYDYEGTSKDQKAVTRAYDTDGNPLWSAAFNGTVNGADVPVGVKLDGAGNVYVAGSTGSGDATDLFVVKYNKSNGNVLWSTGYNNIFDTEDHANAFTVDAGGNVYVVGSTDIGFGTKAFTTIQFDSGGDFVWGATYSTGNGEEPFGVAVSSDGNVYVVGYSIGPAGAGGKDIAIVAYDFYGDELWHDRYNGPGNSDDIAAAVAVDTAGNAYVLGTSRGNGTGNDVFLRKYDADGGVKWTARYNSGGTNDDTALRLFLDKQASAYVLAAINPTSATSKEILALKYNSDGLPLWFGRYHGTAMSALPDDVASDTQGSLYIAGLEHDNATPTAYRASLVKFSPYSPLDVSVGGDGKVRLLTARADGGAAHLQLNDDTGGQVLRVDSIPSPKDCTPLALATSPADNTTYVLFQHSDGQAQILRYSADLSSLLANASFGPIGKQRPANIALGRDGKLRLIWRGTDATNRGAVYLWTIKADLSSVEGTAPYAPPTADQPIAVGLGQDSFVRVFFKTTGSLSTGRNWLWTLSQGGGTLLSTSWYGPPATATLRAQDMTMGGDSKARLLFQDVSPAGGQGSRAQLWRLSVDGSTVERQFVLASPRAGAQALQAASGLFSRPTWVLWSLPDGRSLLRPYDPTFGSWPTQYLYYTF